MLKALAEEIWMKGEGGLNWLVQSQIFEGSYKQVVKKSLAKKAIAQVMNTRGDN